MTAHRATWPITVAIAVVALAARLVPVLHGAGLYGIFGYDEGVYYSGATALVFGRLPYRDFVFLHPPGVLLALAPFGALARLSSDPTGWAVGRVVFMAIGAVNAALVYRVGARFGTVAAVTAGLFYALWNPNSFAERSTLLEPLGNAGLLVALLLLLRVSSAVTPRAELLAGVALGIATTVKIWGVVPWLIIAVWQLRASGRQAAARVVAGGSVACVVVCGVFFAAAPVEMFRMVVLAQLSRPFRTTSPVTRLSSIAGISWHLSAPSTGTLLALLAVVVPLGLAAVAACWRVPGARILVVLLVGHTLLLGTSKSYFAHYATFVGPQLALVFGLSLALLAAWASSRVERSGAVVVAVAMGVVVLLGLHAMAEPLGRRMPVAQLAAALPRDGCIAADDNGALVQLDVLSRNLRRGCPQEVDFTGRTYDRSKMRYPDGSHVPRGRNTVWQRDALKYLTTGSATVLARGPGNGFSRRTLARLEKLPLLAGDSRFQVRGR